MSFAIILAVVVTFLAIDGTKCGVLDIFNADTDYNLASAIDTVFGKTRNDASYLLYGEVTTPVEEDVTFWCGNRNSTTLKQTFLDDVNLEQKIDLAKPLTFIIHGWLDNVTRNWLQNMAQDVLVFADTNVCEVNWAHLARFNYYQASLNHTPIVSGYFSQFIEFVRDAGIPLADITLVGHSLGAQICGQVGRNFGGNIGQIYGLDPAGPLFTSPRDRGLQYRLDISDASYVQMIITSRYTLGVGIGDGHENFYPNGGYSPQTNCVLPLTSDAVVADQIVCSHFHATSLFRLSLNPSIVYNARRCVNWAEYVLSFCNHSQANVLGVYSNRDGGDYFLKTSARSPYTV